MLQGLTSRPYQILQVGRLGCLVDLLVVGLEAIGGVSWIDAALCSPHTSLPHLLAYIGLSMQVHSPCWYARCLETGRFCLPYFLDTNKKAGQSAAPLQHCVKGMSRIGWDA